MITRFNELNRSTQNTQVNEFIDQSDHFYRMPQAILGYILHFEMVLGMPKQCSNILDILRESPEIFSLLHWVLE